jgi:hypothetical protein
MYKTILAAAAVVFAMSAAHATQPGNNGNGNGGCGNGQQTNGCPPTTPAPVGGAGGAGGQGGAGGHGGTGVGVGVGIANAAAAANAAALAQQAQQQAQGQQQQATATGGHAAATGGAAVGTGGASTANGTVTTTVAGDTTVVERNAPPAYAPDGKAPRTSCRIFIGLGGSNTGGAISGGFPIGNDGICVAGAKIEFMDKVNQVKPGTFKVADYLRAACEVEGMDKTDGCKEAADKRAAAELFAPVAERRPMPWQAGG